ncbi:GntR family transcriptional regulator [Streptomyces sp. YC504]|uniref:GntR family transcriptional regulator n=1 Tax=Streptomyces mesophilus TaxID=1775132 RepID=A0A6G4XFZ9_9ACTN|nr:GntR family transcriptional regulator [Streptomyces mesophilus]NGO76328.1 GntR family transcriptional regulator [Streptomyces mesophilus]
MASVPRAPLAALPVYQRIASCLAAEISAGRIRDGSRLPAERDLAERFGVARQTVRAALELLRSQRLITTGRRGTYASARPKNSTPALREADASPFLPARAHTTVRGALFTASTAPSVAAALGVTSGSQVLHYRHTTASMDEEQPRDAVTYFTPTAVMEIPELSRYLQRVPVENPDLSNMPLWCRRAGIQSVLRESVTLSRSLAEARDATLHLSVRRSLHDQHHRLLALTDFTIPLAWNEITFEYLAPAHSAHHYAVRRG